MARKTNHLLRLWTDHGEADEACGDDKKTLQNFRRAAFNALSALFGMSIEKQLEEVVALANADKPDIAAEVFFACAEGIDDSATPDQARLIFEFIVQHYMDVFSGIFLMGDTEHVANLFCKLSFAGQARFIQNLADSNIGEASERAQTILDLLPMMHDADIAELGEVFASYLDRNVNEDNFLNYLRVFVRIIERLAG